MRTSWTTAGCSIILGLLALAPRTAAAQSNPFDNYDVPPVVHNFTGGTVRSLDQEFQADIYVLDAFDGRRSVHRYDRATIERPQPWRFYGRLGPMHFQNREPNTKGLKLSWRRTGPSLTGRVYVGIYRTFH